MYLQVIDSHTSHVRAVITNDRNTDETSIFGAEVQFRRPIIGVILFDVACRALGCSGLFISHREVEATTTGNGMHMTRRSTGVDNWVGPLVKKTAVALDYKSGAGLGSERGH